MRLRADESEARLTEDFDTLLRLLRSSCGCSSEHFAQGSPLDLGFKSQLRAKRVGNLYQGVLRWVRRTTFNPANICSIKAAANL
jgi:hypothetical protein